VTTPGLADAPEAERAMRRGAEFFRREVASGGGYVWRYSSDLKHRQGEGVAPPLTNWVQPPGTPAIGEAYLEALAATQDRFYLDAAREAAEALIRGQLQSGGWYYRVELDPARRREFRYRLGPASAKRASQRGRGDVAEGWDLWKKRENKDDITIVDDDNTPSAVRFLVHLDRALDFKDGPVHEAANYALASLLKAQFPVGAWCHNYDRFPTRNPDQEHYPILDASYPESWSRTWTKDFTGCYLINDRITMNVIKTMLVAWEVYGDERYKKSAEQGGAFLLRAQLPDPQPAWAQQYDRQMHPVWDRKFEPPAITGLESQDVLETLILLARKTGDRKYLTPIPRALAYLKSCRLPDGRLARFYELKTNRPLYFTRDYELTYDGDRVPTHYGFTFDSRLDAIEAAAARLSRGDRPADDDGPPRATAELAAQVREIIAGQDPRGAWTAPGTIRDLEGRKVMPEGDIIESATFIKNMKALGDFIVASKR
jgi:hypothetical protein